MWRGRGGESELIKTPRNAFTVRGGEEGRGRRRRRRRKRKKEQH